MKQPEIQIVSSLEKVFAQANKPLQSIQTVQLLQNEAASFQVVYGCEDPAWDGDCYCRVEIESPLAQHVKLYTVEVVPCRYPAFPGVDGDYLSKTPCLVPDVLEAWDGHALRLRAGVRQSLWVEIFCSEGLQPGTYPLTVLLKDRKGTVHCAKTLQATVLPAMLPAMQLRHTEWFYCDCLCDQYGCEMFSDAFFEIASRYVKFAVEHGVNMLLTPVFTPSLDVEEGCSRRKAQLVGIRCKGDTYEFDFSLLRRWVETFRACGIESFEIAPFFTQWGSKYAVEVYACPENSAEETKRFGWHTPAHSPEYAAFLAQFLPRLVEVLRQCGVQQQTYFHISDEPSLEHMEAYRKAYHMVAPYVEGCPIIDALSDYSFYKEGLVQFPVVANNHMQPFARSKVPHLWTYYCCVQGDKVPNRFLAMPSRRNRIMGVLLYLYQIEGFLHWGYNYWYTQFSKERIDPYRVTDAGLGFPAGDSFLVYPGKEGTPVASLRIKVLREALQDLRALLLLEQLSSRAEVCALIRRICGNITFKKYPRSDETLLALRTAVNEALQTLL